MLISKNYLSKFSCHPEPFDSAQDKRSEGSHSFKARFFAQLRMTRSTTYTPSFKGRGQLLGLSLLIILLIKLYQNSFALIFPRSCRFYPSCSEYGILALRKFGLFKGTWLIVKRLGKCHPFHPGGYDPV